MPEIMPVTKTESPAYDGFDDKIHGKGLSLLAIRPCTHRRAVRLVKRLPLHQLRIASFRPDRASEPFEAQRASLAKTFITPGLVANPLIATGGQR